jgi:hypothetical protein
MAEELYRRYSGSVMEDLDTLVRIGLVAKGIAAALHLWQSIGGS